MSVFVKDKLLFVHIPKTAGASIIDAIKTANNVCQIPNNRTNNNNWHSTYLDCVEHIGDLKHYYKFSIVRNPWNRATSYYFFRKRILQDGIKKLSIGKKFRLLIDDYETIQTEYDIMCDGFDPWLQKYFNKPWDHTWFSLAFNQSHWLKGGDFDLIIKFENLDQDIKHLQIDNLPHRHLSENSKLDWKSLYSDKSKKLIQSLYEEDIDVFKYTF